MTEAMGIWRPSYRNAGAKPAEST